MSIESAAGAVETRTRWGGEDLALVWITCSAEWAPRRAEIHAMTMAGDRVVRSPVPAVNGRPSRWMRNPEGV